ncbi:MAG TPA: septum formation protein Maf [Anaerolineae bacterium]|nr:septum formation protein Maf [Caldilineae bacterium]HID35412.1 septum formation protein Maf [Anaerolineae bacterium]HIQ12464.1 septum formation protein Maf [Caldilineales bacterium]
MLILASASPRRRQLLAALGIPFAVDVADIDESRVGVESPEAHVCRLAEDKARAVAARHPHDIILAADTIVALDGQILGKPGDEEEAWAMLRALRDRAHQVITAVAVAQAGVITADLDVSTVVMRAYADMEIAAYIASGDPFDKAGAYAIQNPEFHPVARLEGCFAGVMGLPLALTARLLTAAGLSPAPHWPQACHAITGQCCQMF